MEIHTNIPLKNYTTMRLGGNARFMSEVRTQDEVANVYRNAKSHSLAVFVLGDGSNVIAKDTGFDGLIMRIRIPGFEIVAEDLNTTTIKIGAGENWDSVVKRIVDMRLTGVEAMSGIPGTTGATPIQNVGAYGQEIADTLESVEAYDTQSDNFVTIVRADCGFAYRDSIFRRKAKGRYVITSVTLKLSKTPPQPPFYETLQTYFDEHGIKMFTQEVVRLAVLAIRTDKLPDPQLLPNVGSFFKNAIVEDWQLKDIQKTYPAIPTYDMAEGKFKIPTGWLIEQAGLSGTLLHGMRVHDKNALVLINESATSYQDLAAARNEIQLKVQDTFHVQIEQEPLEIQ